MEVCTHEGRDDDAIIVDGGLGHFEQTVPGHLVNLALLNGSSQVGLVPWLIAAGLSDHSLLVLWLVGSRLLALLQNDQRTF